MIPFIRAQRGGIAEFVGDKLDKKIRDNLRDSRNSLFQQEMGQLTFNRPVILLLDRNFDLMTPLSHSWTYQGKILYRFMPFLQVYLRRFRFETSLKR